MTKPAQHGNKRKTQPEETITTVYYTKHLKKIIAETLLHCFDLFFCYYTLVDLILYIDEEMCGIYMNTIVNNTRQQVLLLLLLWVKQVYHRTTMNY